VKGSCLNEDDYIILEVRKPWEGKESWKMISKFNLGKRVEGEMVVTHFYLIIDTCKFTLMLKLSLTWVGGSQETNIFKMLDWEGLQMKLPAHFWGWLDHEEMALWINFVMHYDFGFYIFGWVNFLIDLT